MSILPPRRNQYHDDSYDLRLNGTGVEYFTTNTRSSPFDFYGLQRSVRDGCDSRVVDFVLTVSSSSDDKRGVSDGVDSKSLQRNSFSPVFFLSSIKQSLP